mmetsp:Transcript_36975/g.44728  ORF Transcript_36975/g.44728 Transcript_36975/m.44728 type:complete len:359 (-) Transcript_36975:120-1196(-)
MHGSSHENFNETERNRRNNQQGLVGDGVHQKPGVQCGSLHREKQVCNTERHIRQAFTNASERHSHSFHHGRVSDHTINDTVVVGGIFVNVQPGHKHTIAAESDQVDRKWGNKFGTLFVLSLGDVNAYSCEANKHEGSNGEPAVQSHNGPPALGESDRIPTCIQPVVIAVRRVSIFPNPFGFSRRRRERQILPPPVQTTAHALVIDDEGNQQTGGHHHERQRNEPTSEIESYLFLRTCQACNDKTRADVEKDEVSTPANHLASVFGHGDTRPTHFNGIIRTENPCLTNATGEPGNLHEKGVSDVLPATNIPLVSLRTPPKHVESGSKGDDIRGEHPKSTLKAPHEHENERLEGIFLADL